MKAKHGMSATSIYNIWRSMRQRCENPTAKDYRFYGARGIAVCAEWQDFLTFFADMGHPPSGKTLDRINNDGDYCKANCRWASPTQQANNKRARGPFVEVSGVHRPVSEIEKSLGLTRGAIWQRINKKGWSLERAITTPRMEYPKRTRSATIHNQKEVHR